MKESFQIAIDGPVAAGKSTVARRLAERLGFLYFDTGAMYRSVALMAVRKGIATDDKEGLVGLVRELDIDVRLPNQREQDGRQSSVLLNGEDVSWEIRKGKVNKLVARIAQLTRVREALVLKQQLVARGKDVVMEGRDITYVVLPEADLRIFLDATEEVRQERYLKSRGARKKGLTRESVSAWLRERDELDRNRKVSPLKIVEGVWHLDTSKLSIDEVVDLIVERVDSMRNKNK